MCYIIIFFFYSKRNKSLRDQGFINVFTLHNIRANMGGWGCLVVVDEVAVAVAVVVVVVVQSDTIPLLTTTTTTV